jgi:hypothetical protein
MASPDLNPLGMWETNTFGATSPARLFVANPLFAATNCHKFRSTEAGFWLRK